MYGWFAGIASAPTPPASAPLASASESDVALAKKPRKPRKKRTRSTVSVTLDTQEAPKRLHTAPEQKPVPARITLQPPSQPPISRTPSRESQLTSPDASGSSMDLSGFQLVAPRARTPNTAKPQVPKAKDRYLPDSGESPLPHGAVWIEANAAAHYYKHPETRSGSVQEYERTAKILHAAGINGSTRGFRDKINGTIYRFDTRVGLLSAATQDGVIKTAYKPHDAPVSITYKSPDGKKTAVFPSTPDIRMRYLAAVNYFNDTDKPLAELSGRARHAILARAREKLQDDSDLII